MLYQLTQSVLAPQPSPPKSEEVRSTEIPCPRCGRGVLLRGRTAFGCSAYHEGCDYRIPFDLCPETSSIEALQSYIERSQQEPEEEPSLLF